MNVQELIDTLADIKDKSGEVYMRIGGLPLCNVDKIELDDLGDVILFEDNA